MYTITLINLAADALSATEGGGPLELGDLSAEELRALLDTFAELDPTQNMKADPEIRIQTRRDRFIIRTGQKKLFLYDARRLSDPAFVLTSSEVLAELDGSAVAKRAAQPTVMVPPSGDGSASGETAGAGEITAFPVVETRPWQWRLFALVVALGGYIAYAEIFAPEAAELPALTPLTQSERLAEDAVLTGVYMTGSEPGQHGIVILGDGKLKIFVVHAQAAPGVVYGTYQMGRLDAKLCLATDQPGGLIKLIDREELEYTGERYKRIP